MLSPYATPRGWRRQSPLGTGQESIPASADNDDGDFSLDNNASEANFAAELRLAIPARHFNMHSRASKCRTKASVESLLQDWHKGAKTAQRQFQKDAQLLVTLLNQQIPTPPLSSKSCLPRPRRRCVSLTTNWLNWITVWMKNS